MKLRTAIRIFAVASAFVFIAGCADESFRNTVREQWSAADVTHLSVEGVNGEIDVVEGTDDQITMVASVEIKGSRREKDDLNRALKIEKVGDRLVVEERTERKPVIWLFGRRGQRIDMKFTVPPAMKVSLHTVNGRLNVSGVDGQLRLQTVNGRITVLTNSAVLNASTVNGRIEAEFSKAFRGAQFKTVNGGVRIGVPSGSSIACDIRQVNGSFQSEIPVYVRETGRSGAHGTVGSGEYRLEVTTVNGSVVLSELPPVPPASPVPPDPAADIVPPAPPLPDMPAPQVPDMPAPPAQSDF